MSTPDQTAAPVSAEDAAALARVGGIPLPEERLARFAAELEPALGFVRDLDGAALTDAAAVPGPFDPAWPAGEASR